MEVNFTTRRKILNVQQDLTSCRSLRPIADKNDQKKQFSIGHLAQQVDISYFEGCNTIFIHINDLSENHSTNAKLFQKNISLFSILRNINTSAIHLNIDLSKTSVWTLQWKLSFLILPPVKKPMWSYFLSQISKDTSTFYLL